MNDPMKELRDEDARRVWSDGLVKHIRAKADEEGHMWAGIMGNEEPTEPADLPNEPHDYADESQSVGWLGVLLVAASFVFGFLFGHIITRMFA
jgi:hypothetical protein